MHHNQPRTKNTPSHWVGADVAKRTFDAALVRSNQKFPATPLRELPVRTFKRSSEGVRQCLVWLDTLTQDSQTPLRVVMEATGRYSTELALWMCEQRSSLRPAIVNAHQTAAYIKSFNLRNKTDGLEARALAFYGLERQPAAYEPLTRERAELRELSRHRHALIGQKVALTNRAAEQSASKSVRQSQQRLKRTFEREIKKTEAEMERAVEASQDLKRDVEQLSTIYGVAFITATVILSELGDLRRFDRARQLTAFAGLSPKIIQSGTSVHGRSRMCKHGSSYVRQALYMAAKTVVRGQSDLQRTYRKFRAQGRTYKAALAVVMRKLLTIMRSILISGRAYEPNWKTGGRLREKLAR